MTFTVKETDIEIARRLCDEGTNTIVVTVVAVNDVKVRDLWALELELDDLLREDGVLKSATGSTFICDVDDVPQSYERDPQDILVTLR